MTNDAEQFLRMMDDEPLLAAFQYFEDEFTETQAAAFEDRLAESETLQQALIDVTRQSIALAALPTEGSKPLPARQNASSSSKRITITVVGLALSLVTAVVILNQSNDLPVDQLQTAEASEQIQDSDLNVAFLDAWVETDDLHSERVESDFEATSDLAVPDWMLTAVLLDEFDDDSNNRLSEPGAESI